MSGAKQVDDDTDEMVFELMVALFGSPAWDFAVMSFIDEHCEQFEHDEENKLCYTTIHQEFVDVVEGLITRELGKAGIGSDSLVKACERARELRETNKTVFQQMLAMSDFLTFKKLMVRRNAELGYEALQQMNDEPITAPVGEREAATEFRSAAKEESDMSVAEARDLVGEQAPAEAKGDDAAAVDAKLKHAMDENLREMELLHQEEEMEQLELEEAIAQSLAIEQQRVTDEIEQMELQGTIAASIAEAKTSSEERKCESAREERKESKKEPNPLAPLINPARKNSLSSSLAPLAPLPNIEELQRQMREKRRQAEATFARNQELLREQTQQKHELEEAAGVTAEDLERRRKQLKKQRDRILSKKKKERKEKADVYAEEQAAAKKALASGKKEKKEEKEEEKASPAEDRAARVRADMSKALARRLKAELVESQHDRLRTIESQTAELDEKLRTVLQLRMHNREKERQLQDAITQHQAQRFKNIKLSVARDKMTREDDDDDEFL